MNKDPLNRFHVSIDSFFLFHSEIMPDNPSAREEEILDMQILFFYPEDLNEHARRNLVGLIHGSGLIFGQFFASESQDSEITIIESENTFYVSQEVEESLYFVFILHKENKGEYPTHIPLIKRFCNNFKETYILFQGPIVLVNGKEFSADDKKKFSWFLENYALVQNKSTERQISLHRFAFDSINYAPVEERSFLNFLNLQQRLQLQFPSIKHTFMAIKGFLVHSSFGILMNQILYQYFYVSANPLEIEENKIVNYFFETNGEEIESCFGKKCGVENTPNWLIGIGSKGFNVFIKENGDVKVYSFAILSFKNIHVVIFFDSGSLSNDDEKYLVRDVIERFAHMYSDAVKDTIQKTLAVEEFGLFLYRNNENLAIKCSKPLSSKLMTNPELLIPFIEELIDVKTEFRMRKVGKYYLILVNSGGRTLVSLYPDINTMSRIEEEQNKILKSTFKGVYMSYKP